MRDAAGVEYTLYACAPIMSHLNCADPVRCCASSSNCKLTDHLNLFAWRNRIGAQQSALASLASGMQSLQPRRSSVISSVIDRSRNL